MEDQAQGQRWRILLKIKSLLLFIFKAKVTSKIEEEDENLSKIEEEDENLCNCNRWADLPPDLLERILMSFPPKDVVRICSVCTAWTSVLLASSMRLLRLPWLLFYPVTKTTKPFPFITFVCPNENLCFDIRLPFDICDFKLSGIMGWLHVRDPANHSYLLNPLNQVRIPIPYYLHQCEYNKSLFAMSETNIKTNSFPTSLKILCNSWLKLYLDIKPFPEKWITLSSIFEADQDILYYQNKFYVLLKDGQLIIYDLNGPYPSIRKMYRLKEVESRYDFKLLFSKSYLVQNSGNIYQLLVNHTMDQIRCRAFKLKIDQNDFFSYSHDHIFSATEKYYKDYAKHSKWIYDDTILDVNQIFLDDRKAIFIPAHDGCGFKYLGNRQVYHVDTFKASHLSRVKPQSQNYYNDKFFWFMPANY